MEGGEGGGAGGAGVNKFLYSYCFIGLRRNNYDGGHRRYAKVAQL